MKIIFLKLLSLYNHTKCKNYSREIKFEKSQNNAELGITAQNGPTLLRLHNCGILFFPASKFSMYP